MALTALVGLPRSGKTETLTDMALKHYSRTNSLLRKCIRKYMHKPIIINNVYTNYPILLDKKNNIYSNIVHIDDLKNQYSFLPHSFIGFDEPQLDYESLDFKMFPRAIGMFMQAHGHFLIDDIVFATQHPNRLVMYEKNIMTEYKRIHNIFKIPFTPYKLLIIRSCYELCDYDYICTRDKEVRRMHDIKIHFKLTNSKKVHSRYKSRYLSVLNSDKPLINKGTYTNLDLTEEQKESYNKKFRDNAFVSKKEQNARQKEIANFFDTGRKISYNSDKNFDFFGNL